MGEESEESAQQNSVPEEGPDYSDSSIVGDQNRVKEEGMASRVGGHGVQ